MLWDLVPHSSHEAGHGDCLTHNLTCCLNAYGFVVEMGGVKSGKLDSYPWVVE